MNWVFNRIVFGIFRVIAHGPCIALAANAVPMFVKIRKHPLPQNFPYGKEIYASQGITAILATILPVWMAVTGICILASGSLRKKKYWVLPYCILDWGMVGMMILSIIWQSWYLPTTSGACSSSSISKGCSIKYRKWNLTEADPSLFCQLGTQVNTDPQKVCRQFQLIWILNICTVGLTGFTAVYPTMRVSIPWPIVWTYGWVMWHLKSIRKVGGIWKFVKGRWKARRTAQDVHNQDWRLTRKVTLFDIFNEDTHGRAVASVAKTLHYSDIVALSLVSRAFNSAIFPKQPTKGRRERISQAACETGKEECWSCGMEICTSCKFEKAIATPRSTTHIHSCEPYCSTCYYKFLCRRYVSGAPNPERGYTYYRPACLCRDTTPKFPKERAICKFCYALPEGAALGVREDREKAEMRHLIKQQLRCTACTMGLAKAGQRWWGCSLCSKECVSDFHPVWETKKLR